MGIEPTLAAWEAAVLPLNYTRRASGILTVAPADIKPRESVLFRLAPALYNIAIPMNIVLNGETKPFDAPLTVAELIARLGLTGARVAVEVNQEIVPRSRHGERVLRDSDRVEVVRAIGGG